MGFKSNSNTYYFIVAFIIDTSTGEMLVCVELLIKMAKNSMSTGNYWLYRWLLIDSQIQFNKHFISSVTNFEVIQIWTVVTTFFTNISQKWSLENILKFSETSSPGSLQFKSSMFPLVVHEAVLKAFSCFPNTKYQNPNFSKDMV